MTEPAVPPITDTITRGAVTARRTWSADPAKDPHAYVVDQRCVTCNTQLTDDDRGPLYDSATDDGTPHSCPGDGIAVKSDIGPDGIYILSVEVNDDFSFVLNPNEAIGHAMCVLTAVASAEHDACVARQLTSIGLSIETVAMSINELRTDRPPIPWKHPFQVVPGVTSEGKPFLAIELQHQQIGQWEPDDARSYALAVLETTITCDLDNAYFRHLRGLIEVDEGRARNVVNDLLNWRYGQPTAGSGTPSRQE